MSEISQAWAGRFGLEPSRLAPLGEQLEVLGHPAGAVAALERLLERVSESGFEFDILAESTAQRALARLAHAAPFLLRHLAAEPGWLAEGVLSGLEEPASLLPFNGWADPATVPGLEPNALQEILRHWKYANLLRITARDLLGLSGARETCALLSQLADGTIRVAHGHAFTRLVGRRGLPLRAEGGLAGGAVMGMGKLGGGELNYASDVDLIFLHDGEGGQCRILPDPPDFPIDPATPPAEYWSQWEALADRLFGLEPERGASGEGLRPEPNGGPVGEALRPEPGDGAAAEEFHDELARQTAHLVSAQTGGGFGFRVDLDLRPQGKSGLLAPSLAFLYQYYDLHGREWERVALIKARHVAGQPAVYDAFHDYIRPFVYRRYLDFGALEGITIVKRDIDRHHRGALAGNVKLGRGGIRENEFFVQALQLLHGGKHPELQVAPHELALRRLMEAEIVPAEVGERHLADYWLLRDVENRIQMIGESQSQELPTDPEGRERVFCDFMPGWRERLAEREAAVQSARDRNAERFAGLLSESLTEEETPPDAWREVLRRRVASPMREELEGRIGALFDGLMRTRTGEACVLKAERLLARPELYLEGCEAALPRWLEFLERIGNRNTIFALLAAHPPMLVRVSTLFAEGGRLATPLIRHPEFVESFIGLSAPPDDIARAVERAKDEEEFILDVQAAKARATILILARYLEQDGSSHRETLSDLADSTVRACLSFAWRRTVARFGPPSDDSEAEPFPGFAVLALGKAGSREMRFGSDLDLVYCYRDDGTTGEGASHFEFYTRLAQTLGNLLTAPTQFGSLYELDHRLRPFGSKGVLVPTLGAYRSFLADAEVWNFQALTRIRAVAGDETLAADLIESLAQAWQEQSIPTDTIAGRVHSMMHRLVEEHGPKVRERLGLKYGVGGMIGFEFLQQFRFLENARGKGSAWRAPDDDPVTAPLRPTYDAVGALDERLSLHVDRFGHEAAAEDFRALPAIRERWQFAGIRDSLAEQAERVEGLFAGFLVS